MKNFALDVKNKELRRIKAYMKTSPAFVSFLRYWLMSSNKGFDI